MTTAEVVLVATATGLLGSLVAGAGMYVKLARGVLTRDEHEKECMRATTPILRDIGEIKTSTKRLEEKLEQTSKELRDRHDSSTKDLSDKLQRILFEVAKINGRGV